MALGHVLERRRPVPAARRSAGSASSSSASASRSAWLRRPRIAGATAPTWRRDQAQAPRMERLAERHGGVAVADTSSPRRCAPRRRRGASARRSPASLAEAWTISSCSRGAVVRAWRSAQPKRCAPGRRAIGSMSTTVTRAPGCAPAARPPAARPRRRRSPACARRPAAPRPTAMFSAVSMLAASTARAVGTASGTGMHIAAGARKRSWCGCSTKTRCAVRRVPRPRRCSRISPGTGIRPPISGARIAGYWLAGTRPGEHQRLGAARDAAGQRAHQHLVRRGGGRVSSRISPRPGATVQNARAAVHPA